MANVEKKVESLSKKHEVLFLAILIVVILIILFSFVKIPEKNIADLQKEESGKFKLIGYINNVDKKSINITQFKISDETGSINATIFEQIDLNNGNIIEGVCELNVWNYVKKCNLTDFSIKN